MEEIVLQAQRRDVLGKQVKALRRQGKLPAIVYGHRIQPLSITLDTREASRQLAGVTSSLLITINVDGERHTVLVREKQRNPIHGTLLHVDFLAVSMTEKLRANVVISLDGDAPAVKDYDGIVVTGIEQLEVECLPADLPERVTIDLSSLAQIGAAIYVRDIQLPSAVEVLTDLDEMVVLITAPAVEVTEEEVAVEGEEEPEVIEKGKKEEEEY
jgi:large subunit ribosomal protein L25